jgi:integrase/recombinase XerD
MYAESHRPVFLNDVIGHQEIKEKSEDIVFLNRRGKQLSRVMIFLIIKEIVTIKMFTKFHSRIT